MNLTAILALVKNDLRIHFIDRRGVLINIAAAVFIGSPAPRNGRSTPSTGCPSTSRKARRSV
jgi:hypothetical protein